MLLVFPPQMVVSILITDGAPQRIVPPAMRGSVFANGIYVVFQDDIGFAGE